MTARRGEKGAWLGGWLGGFLRLAILGVVWWEHGRHEDAAAALAVFVTAVLLVLLVAPWRHPATR